MACSVVAVRREAEPEGGVVLGGTTHTDIFYQASWYEYSRVDPLSAQGLAP